MSLPASIVWWAAIILGFSKNITFSVPASETLGVQVYGAGRPNAQCQIISGSKEQDKLAAWLAQNKEGWKATLATYVPGVLVSGNDFSINFLGSSVILNYESGQYAHSIEPKQYEFLLCGNRA